METRVSRAISLPVVGDSYGFVATTSARSLHASFHQRLLSSDSENRTEVATVEQGVKRLECTVSGSHFIEVVL
jgi:hypothetical protein